MPRRVRPLAQRSRIRAVVNQRRQISRPRPRLRSGRRALTPSIRRALSWRNQARLSIGTRQYRRTGRRYAPIASAFNRGRKRTSA